MRAHIICHLVKPVAPPPVKPNPPKPTTVAGISRPAPPPVTIVKAPPATGNEAASSSKKAYERQAECAKCNNPIRCVSVNCLTVLVILMSSGALMLLP